MEINDYKEIIAKTAIFPNEVTDFGLAYSWLGLIEESEEARNAFETFRVDTKNDKNKKALVKELGDVCWYITNIAVIENLDLEEIFTMRTNLSDLIGGKTITAYCGNIKKYYRDGKAVDKQELTNILTLLINGMMLSVNLYDIKLETVLEINYNKLMKRRETNTIQGDGDNREEQV